nr:O-antigen ligase family protein [Ardenticatena sp.]
MRGGRLTLILFSIFGLMMPLERFTTKSLGPGDAAMVAAMGIVWLLVWKEHARVHIPLALGMWLIFVGTLLGTLTLLGISTVALALVQEVYLYALFLTMVNTFTKRDAYNRFMLVLTGTAALSAVYVILSRLGVRIAFLTPKGGKNAALALRKTDPEAFLQSIGRASGTFSNSNAAGGYLLLAMYLFLALPLGKHTWLKWPIGAFFLFAIFMTGSNGAFLGALLGLGVLGLAWLGQQGRALLLLGATLALSVSLLAIVTPIVGPMLFDQFSEQDFAFAYVRIADKMEKRTAIWREGFDAMIENPLGIGANMSADVASAGMHNDYVAFFVERGLIGFIGLMVLFGELFFALAMAARLGRTSTEYWTTMALLGGLLGIMLMSTTHEATHGRPLWVLFAAIFLHTQFLAHEDGQTTEHIAGQRHHLADAHA